MYAATIDAHLHVLFSSVLLALILTTTDAIVRLALIACLAPVSLIPLLSHHPSVSLTARLLITILLSSTPGVPVPSMTSALPTTVTPPIHTHACPPVLRTTLVSTQTGVGVITTTSACLTTAISASLILAPLILVNSLFKRLDRLVQVT